MSLFVTCIVYVWIQCDEIRKAMTNRTLSRLYPDAYFKKVNETGAQSIKPFRKTRDGKHTRCKNMGSLIQRSGALMFLVPAVTYVATRGLAGGSLVMALP